MDTFKNLCAWGLIWVFFVLVPMSLIGSKMEKNNSVVLNLDGVKYCTFKANADSSSNAGLQACILLLGKIALLNE